MCANLGGQQNFSVVYGENAIFIPTLCMVFRHLWFKLNNDINERTVNSSFQESIVWRERSPMVYVEKLLWWWLFEYVDSFR